VDKLCAFVSDFAPSLNNSLNFNDSLDDSYVKRDQQTRLKHFIKQPAYSFISRKARIPGFSQLLALNEVLSIPSRRFGNPA